MRNIKRIVAVLNGYKTAGRNLYNEGEALIHVQRTENLRISEPKYACMR